MGAGVHGDPAAGGTQDAALLLELGERLAEALIVDLQVLAKASARQGLGAVLEQPQGPFGQRGGGLLRDAGAKRQMRL